LLLGWGLVGGNVGFCGVCGVLERRDEELGKWMKGWYCARYSVCLEGESCLVVLFSYRTICFFLSYFTFSRPACFLPVCIQGD